MTSIPESEPIGAEALRKAIALGGLSKLATDIEVSYQLIQGWLVPSRRFATPAEYCPLIERATGVRCEELRPDVEWSVVRGTSKAAA
jgi:DNA-binding transcriptional regulator YdaS (Cro superfamily)